MDPAAQLILDGLAILVGSYIGIHTGVSALQQWTAGHGRGDHANVITTLIQGGLATGVAFTSPFWVPRMIAIVQSTKVL